MPTFSNPKGVAPPLGPYSHCAVVKAGSDVFHFAGQVGASPDGTVAKTIEEQADYAFANVATLLNANNLAPANLVKVLIYVTDRAYHDAVIIARRKHLGETDPAPATFIVCELAFPELMIEIDVTAAS